MKFHDGLDAVMENIRQRIVESNRNERMNIPVERTDLFKEPGLTVDLPEGGLAEGWKKKCV